MPISIACGPDASGKQFHPRSAQASTAFSYFKQRVDKAVFPQLWKLALEEYDELIV
jgi:hypothetical protein